ncbi:MAG: hypothetical protein EXR92_00925 [Gemmatimonadetes bacterium]|nr:hypothetical protein [Gemmatimonadota bacterium]
MYAVAPGSKVDRHPDRCTRVGTVPTPDHSLIGGRLSHLLLRRALVPFVMVGTGLMVVPRPSIAQVPVTDPPAEASSQQASAPYDHATDAPVARAVRTGEPPVIDGRPDEPVWMTAPPVTELRQLIPDDGAPGTQRTEVRFLYDDESLYVGGWLWDDGEITTRRARRDAAGGDTDAFAIYLDAQHDHRTAFRFATNPSSLKKDEAVTGERGVAGGVSDPGWDPVWEVRSSISDGVWFVEMRIPFSQLRYSGEEVQTWGLQVERKIRHNQEEALWAFTSRRERGGVARMGHLIGIEGIPLGRKLEMLPYVSGRGEYGHVLRAASATFDNPFREGSDYFGDAGIDLKYGLTSNLTLNASVNPDFGQVEMDPAVINLTAFETRVDERRPFFVEGAEIFRFGEGGIRPGPIAPQLLYSRRIGRSPQGAAPGSALYSDMPVTTSILGAVKIAGKTISGWSIGALDAVTRRETAPYIEETGLRAKAVVEPLTNYFAGRVRRDFRGGAASLGVTGTAVHRELGDPVLRSRLRSAAYVAGLDGRIDWDNRAWTLAVELSPSYLTGEAQAIDRAQRSSARYLQRPDDPERLDYNSTATSLAGLYGRIGLSKQAGEWQGRLGVTSITPRYEVNDLGFQAAADRFFVDSDFGYEQTLPGRYLREWGAHVSPRGTWNLGGDPQALGVAVSSSGQLLSYHTFSLRAERQFAAWDDRITRGGPIARAPAGYALSADAATNARATMQLRGNGSWSKDDAGGWAQGVGLGFTARFRETYEFVIGPNFSRSHSAAQYVTSVVDPLAEDTFGRRYVFAPLDQTTASLQLRLNTTFRPDLSFELYVEPLVSSGDYGELMELIGARTFEFRRYAEVGRVEAAGDGSYVVDPDGSGPAGEFSANDLSFNRRSLLGNAVLRWEWRPGTTLFLVWQQTRSGKLTPDVGDTAQQRIGSFNLGRDAGALFGLRPNNIFVIKLNYWLNE